MNPEAMVPDIYVAGESRCCKPQGRQVWQCGTCGRYWYRSNETDGCAPPMHLWKQVRWWHFRLRAAIRTAPRALAPAPPNGDHNPARPGDCQRLCGAPGCASWGCLH